MSGNALGQYLCPRNCEWSGDEEGLPHFLQLYTFRWMTPVLAAEVEAVEAAPVVGGGAVLEEALAVATAAAFFC